MSEFTVKINILTSITLLLVFLLSIFSVSAYIWSPQSYCSNQQTTLTGPQGTKPILYVTLPNGTTMPITNIITSITNTWTEKICAADNDITSVYVKEDDISDSPFKFSVKDACAAGTNGIEGAYSFAYYAHKDTYCTLSGLTVDWNDDDSWCIQNECGRGDYKSTIQRQNRCCSPREMDSNFKYTNEDCNEIELSGTTLCYFVNNYTGKAQKYQTETGVWLDANSILGEIIYEGCGDISTTPSEDGFEFLSYNNHVGGFMGLGGTDVPSWAKCTRNGFVHSLGVNLGKILTLSKPNDNDPTVNLTHQYACIDWLAPRRYSVAECIGGDDQIFNSDDTYDGSAGGIVAYGGHSVNLSDKKVYFCTNKNTWSDDLDNYELAGEDGTYCRRATLPKIKYEVNNSVDNGVSLNASWTGNYCCGELDDYAGTYPSNMAFSINNEYYNDDDRLGGHFSSLSNGACFDSRPQANQTFLNLTEANSRFKGKQIKEVMVWHGTFQGCAIDSDNALAKKTDSSENEGKMREQLVCALPNNINKPYGGTFRKGINASTYGYAQTGNDGNDFLLDIQDMPNNPQTGVKSLSSSSSSSASSSTSSGGSSSGSSSSSSSSSSGGIVNPAKSLYVDFGGDGAYTGSGMYNDGSLYSWNVISTHSSSENLYSGLSFADGTPSQYATVSVSGFSTPGGYGSYIGGSGVHDKMFESEIWDRITDSTQYGRIKLVGLGDGIYDIVVYGPAKTSGSNQYSLMKNSANVGTIQSIGGNTVAPASWQQNVQYVVFSNVAIISSDIIEIDVIPSFEYYYLVNYYKVDISGLQVKLVSANPVTGGVVSKIGGKSIASLLAAGDPLIHDNEYCNIKEDGPGGKKYFCSYNETWKEDTTDDENNRSHLSFIAWNNVSAQQAECCTPTQCWDGTNCIESVEITFKLSKPHKKMNSYGDGFICKNGQWSWAYNKTTWDGTQYGYCTKNDQCLIDSSGDRSPTNVYRPEHYAIDEIGNVKRPACINSGEYLEDHYCENGTWTSRTKYAALALYNVMKRTSAIGPKDNYTLHCDTYDHVLNSYTYEIRTLPENIEDTFFHSNPSSKCYSYDNDGDGSADEVPCVNHVCVLTASGVGKDKYVLFAASINHRLNHSIASVSGLLEYIADFGEALGNPLYNSCSQTQSPGFVECGHGTGVYYSNDLGIVLYARDLTSNMPLTFTDYRTAVGEIFSSFIKTIIDRIVYDSSNPINDGSFKYDEIVTMSEDLMSQVNSAYSIQRKDFECNNCVDNNNNGDVRDEVCGQAGNPRKQLDFSTLYITESGARKIVGLSELEAYPYLVGGGGRNPNKFHAAAFIGFDYDICSRFSSPSGPGEGVFTPGYSCISDNRDPAHKKYYVFSKIDQTSPGYDTSFNSIVDIVASEQWRFLTVATRSR